MRVKRNKHEGFCPHRPTASGLIVFILIHLILHAMNSSSAVAFCAAARKGRTRSGMKQRMLRIARQACSLPSLLVKGVKWEDC